MKRLKVIVYLMATIPFLILLARAFVLQILQRESHREYVDSLKVYVRQIEAPRGKILTNDGSPIAWDEEVLVARSTGLMDPNSVEEVVGPERKLKLLLGEEIIVTEAEAIKLQKTGVLISRKYIRKYSNLAPHVVGYIDIDRKGMSGVEKEYDSYLRGTNGYELISISPSGKTFGRFLQAAPIAGNNLILTIDSKIQDYVQKLLKESNYTGTIIVQASDGSILAMASNPDFDPNLFVNSMDRRQWNEISNNPQSPLLNRAISATYPPGSVIKPLYAIAYLEEGLDLTKTVNCKGYFEFVGNSGNVLGTYRDWYVSGHGETDLKKALRVSCNVFFYNLALELGIEKMKQFANLFMLDQLTGVDLPGERTGLFPDPSWKSRVYNQPWYPGDTILCGIGQSFINLTPIEVLNFFNAIANDGTCYQPHVLQLISNQQGEKIVRYEKNASYKVPLKDTTIDFLKDSLKEVVESNGNHSEEGTAYQAFKGLNIDVAGKTGTAETGKQGEKSHSWFVGFSPVKNPEIIVLVMLEKAGGGGEAAAPLARKVFEFWMNNRK